MAVQDCNFTSRVKNWSQDCGSDFPALLHNESPHSVPGNVCLFVMHPICGNWSSVPFHSPVKHPSPCLLSLSLSAYENSEPMNCISLGIRFPVKHVWGGLSPPISHLWPWDVPRSHESYPGWGQVSVWGRVSAWLGPLPASSILRNSEKEWTDIDWKVTMTRHFTHIISLNPYTLKEMLSPFHV